MMMLVLLIMILLSGHFLIRRIVGVVEEQPIHDLLFRFVLHVAQVKSSPTWATPIKELLAFVSIERNIFVLFGEAAMTVTRISFLNIAD